MSYCAYHGEMGQRSTSIRQLCPKAGPVHIRPRGADRILCADGDGVPDIDRNTAPAFVTGLMGATCERCRKRFTKRAS